MSEGLLSRVSKELMKSGFPVELKSSTAFDKKGWAVENNFVFEDTDSNQHRELDILACDAPAIFRNKSCLTFYIFVECKKSEKPWVFFPANTHTDAGRRILACGSMFQYGGKGWQLDKYNLIRHMMEDNSHLSRMPLSSWYTELFSKGVDGHDILDALSKLIKAKRYVTEGVEDKDTTRDPPLLFASYYVIILDGAIVEASFKNNNLKVRESKHVLLSVNYGSPTVREHALVDVIRLDYLQKYLRLVDAEKSSFVQGAEIIYEKLKSSISKKAIDSVSEV